MVATEISIEHQANNECDECSFGLWLPIANLSTSSLGLYSDNRFPGRCILSLTEHYEALEDVPACLLNRFMDDVRNALTAIKKATGSQRVNFAILGNTVSHVHAHLIPRYPENEAFPGMSPWNDSRVKTSLDEVQEKGLVDAISECLTAS